MPVCTRSNENQARIPFRTRKTPRSAPAKVKNIDSLRSSGSYKRERLGLSDAAILLQNPSRQLYVQLPRIKSGFKPSPLKSVQRFNDSKTPSPRKRLFEDVDSSDKENSEGSLKQLEDVSRPSPVKQTKTEVVRSIPEPNKMEDAAAKEKSTMSIAKHEGKQYGLIRQQLHASVPERMLCREKETSIISKFMKKQIAGKKSGSLYVSGPPGTGKTVCLNKVLKNLKEEDLTFQEVWINCMSLSQSSNIYQKIATHISGESLTYRESEQFLEKVIQSKGPKIVLILDEIDQLESKNQEILYKIFEWPSLPNSRLVLVGIANALDLTDRILPRLQSRTKCHPELVHFPPYNKDQIIEILNERLKDVNDGLVDKNTVQFCARKVAAVAGDMRKALDIMRRSVELVEIDTKRQRILTSVTNSPTKDGTSKIPLLQKVTLSHVARVISEVYNSNLSSNGAGKETLPLQQKVVVCTLLLLLKKEKSKEVTLPKLHAAYCSVCQRRQLSYVCQEEFSSVCQLLEARGIISMKQGKNMHFTKVSLRLQESELEYALKDKVLLSTILDEGIPK